MAVLRLRISARSAGEPATWCCVVLSLAGELPLCRVMGLRMLRVFVSVCIAVFILFFSPPVRALFTLFSLPSFVFVYTTPCNLLYISKLRNASTVLLGKPSRGT